NHHTTVTGGVLETECGDALKSFFAERRRASREARAVARGEAHVVAGSEAHAEAHVEVRSEARPDDVEAHTAARSEPGSAEPL
ncbi:MAG TPA: hypothetical protein VFE81_11340, partial [Paraburkholderia sp.]|nr:hypothetical protein [Paraburkholderia sp.]